MNLNVALNCNFNTPLFGYFVHLTKMINNISTTRAGLVVQSTRTTQQHARHGFDPQIDRAAIKLVMFFDAFLLALFFSINYRNKYVM